MQTFSGQTGEPGLTPDPVVVLVYDGVAADEARVVIEVVSLAGLAVTLASVESKPVTSYHGRVVPTLGVNEIGPLSVLVVPGGMGVRRAAEHAPLLAAIRELAGRARWLAATSTGSVLLGAAGAVSGARATTHWLAGDLITGHGLQLVAEPFVEHGRLLTASGVVSCETLALRLVGALVGAEVEAELRSRHRPPVAAADPRYRRPTPSWRSIGRRRVGALSHPVDPAGRAEVITLELIDGPPDG